MWVHGRLGILQSISLKKNGVDWKKKVSCFEKGWFEKREQRRRMTTTRQSFDD